MKFPMRLLTVISIIITCIAPSSYGGQDSDANISLARDMNKNSLKKGLAENWHLDTSSGKITPALLADSERRNIEQKFLLSGKARGTFMTGGRKNGSADDFVKVTPGGIYKFNFSGKKSGNASCYAQIIAFEGKTWKSKNKKWSCILPVNSREWKNNVVYVKAPPAFNYAVVIFMMQGDGEIRLRNIGLTEVRKGELPVDTGELKKMKINRTDISSGTGKTKTGNIPGNKKYGTYIINENGVPALYSFGKKLTPQVMYNATWKPEQVKDEQASFFAKAGININFIHCSLPWPKSPSGESAEKAGAAFSNLDARISNIMAMNPNAKILLNVHLFVPADWFEKYPEEILTAESGRKVPLGKRPMAAVSYASAKWRQASAQRLKNLYDFINKRPYSKNVLGSVLFFGWSGEWNWWIPPKDVPDKKIYPFLSGLAVDYSQPNRLLYQKWLKKKYANIQNLNQKWGTRLKDFSEITPPSLDLISASKYSALKSPAKNIIAIDYFSYYSDMMADCLLEIAHSTKKNAIVPRLVGAYFGGIMHQSVGGAKNIQRSGHLSLEKILNSTDIDFLCNPNYYPTDAVGHFCPGNNFISSINLHGKMYFFEFDHPTSCQKKHEGSHNQWRTLKNLDDSVAVIQRDFCWSLCHNAGIWWWDMDRQYIGASWFSAPEIRENLKNFQRIESEALNKDRSSISEIAVIFSLKSYLYMTTRWDSLGRDIIGTQVDDFGKIGAPFDLYLLDDISKVKPYKLYIFWNAFALTREQREIIRKKLERENATALWLYAPGFISSDEYSDGIEQMQSLTGISFSQSPDPEFAKTQITNPRCRITKKYYKKVIGSENTLEPYFHVNEQKDLIVLGRSPVSGKPNFVVKQFKNWNSIYIEAYPVPAAILAAISKSSGVHLYTEPGEVVMANNSYLAIHFTSKGKKKVTLPYSAGVYNEFSQKLISPKCKEFTVENKNKNSTMLFSIKRK